MERLQKYLASSGVASRRKAEALILAGRVAINGQIIRRLGVTVSEGDTVTLDGTTLTPLHNYVYYALNKPKGIIATSSDDQGRKTVINLVPQSPRVVVCGRLDADSHGLTILTNDGECCYQLTHPKFEHEKEYEVISTLNKGPAIEERLRRLEQGIKLDDGVTSKAKVSHVRRQGMRLIFRITLHEGKNRQVRRMCSAVGLDVIDLARIRVGKLSLHDLPEGRWKLVKKSEIL